MTQQSDGDNGAAHNEDTWHLFAHHPDPMWLFDRQTLQFMCVNNAAVQSYGYSEAEFLAMTIADIRPPDDVPRLMEKMRTPPPEGLDAAGTWHHLRKDGSVIAVDIRAYRVQWKGHDCELVTARDISEQVALEQEREELIGAVRKSRDNAQQIAESFRAVFDAAPGNFLVLRAHDLRITGMSDALCSALGCPREAVMMREADDVLRVPAEEDTDTQKLSDRLRGVRETGVTDVLAAQALTIAGAPTRTWSVVSTPVTSEAGHVRYIILRLDDVTELHEAQTAVNGAGQTTLEAHATAYRFDAQMRANALQRANEQLRQRERALRDAQKAADLGYWEYHCAARHIALSDHARVIWGIADSNAEPDSSVLIALVHPEDRETTEAHFCAAETTQNAQDFVHRIIRSDGEIRHIRELIRFLRTREGDVLSGICQDITPLVEARTQSASIAHRLHETLEQIDDAFVLMDHDGCVRFLNRAAEAMMPEATRDIIGKRVFDVFSLPRDAPFRRQFSRVLRHRETLSFTAWFPPLQRRLAVRAYASRDGVVALLRDVTDAHAREEQLRLLQVAVERLNDVVLITEADPVNAPGPRIVYANPAFEAATGYSVEEAIGQSPRMLQGPATDRATLDRIRHAMEQRQSLRVELQNYRKDGQPFWLEMEIVPFSKEGEGKGNRPTHFIAVQRDITQQKRTADTLRESEERFRLVTRASSDLIWDWNLRDDTVWWSQGAETQFGYGPDPKEASVAAWSACIHADDLARVHDGIYSAIEGDASEWQDEYRFRRADGSFVTVLDRGFILRDATGNAVRMLGSIVDVSQRRASEEAIERAQRLDAIGQLTGGIAHDFNNLLTVIMGNSEMLLESLDRNAESYELADMTLRAAESAAELTSRLLAFSRRQPLSPEALSPEVLVRSLDMWLKRILGNHIHRRIHCSSPVWKVLADASQLENALLNLCLNARDAMPDGGTLDITLENVTLDANALVDNPEASPGDYAAISVSDTGHGFSAEALARAFEPFYTSKGVGRGSGLGLSQVYGFIRQSHGHIRILSPPGKGACVVLYLPRADEAAATAPPVQAKAATTPRGHERVLLVEDEVMLQRHAAGLLRGLGYDVDCAASADEALEMLKDDKADITLLFTDITLQGGMDGYALAERARARRPELKVLCTSGNVDFASQAAAKNTHLPMLRKPYNRRTLAEAVRGVLDT